MNGTHILEHYRTQLAEQILERGIDVPRFESPQY